MEMIIMFYGAILITLAVGTLAYVIIAELVKPKRRRRRRF